MQEILYIITKIRIRDIVDIVIVAFALYKIYMLIQETRAEKLIKGIVLLLLISQISELMQLHVINWILRNTMTVGLIILLIVFQPELRRALEYIGRTNLLTKSIKAIEQEEIMKLAEDIGGATDFLSKSKVGALIVIEKEIGLNEVIESGTRIEGINSQELLINIFTPNAPLHDGAVVIRRNQIMAAGCYLPLSVYTDIAQELGTRHRAGLGITERSDALVVIVSEETGTISMVENGKLIRGLNPDTLKTSIYRSFENRNLQRWNFLKFN